MKNFTLLCLALFGITTSFAGGINQPGKTDPERRKVKNEREFKQAGLNEWSKNNTQIHAPGANQRSSQIPFYSEVFAGGIPPTWQNIDSSGSGVRWTWTTIGTYFDYPGNDSLSTSGTSASNGYLMFDSDSASGTAQGEYGVLITDAIDCSLHPTVRVAFNEFFAKYDGLTPIYPNTARVYVSNDGTNWTLIHASDAVLGPNDETPNPQAVSINVSSIAGGQATVYFKFSFTGDYSYWWFVDDLELSEVGAIDAGIFGILDPFNGCTLSNAEPIVIGIENEGADSLMSIPVSYSINGGVPVYEIIADTLAPGDSLAYVFTTPADLSMPGVYNIVSYTSYPGDGVSSNDTLAISTTSFQPNAVIYNMGFELTDDLSGYSIVDGDGDGEVVDISGLDFRSGSSCLRFPEPLGSVADNWLITNCFDLSSGITYYMEFWYKVFDVVPPAVPYTLEVFIGNSTDINTMTVLVSPPVPIDTAYHNVGSSFTVPSSGSYYIAFSAYGTGVTNPLRIDDFRVDFAVGVNTPILEEQIRIYPNPSQGNIYIENLSAEHGSATITVTNPLGQVIFTQESRSLIKETIDLSNYTEGFYTVQIRTESGVVNKKILVSKR
ncbi:MAG: T9SS type A sorting domain-containing protein [Bacteroidia bacterium]|nr:T9SS type A sorting domain-containing protein [Bacteroidia bacterium]